MSFGKGISFILILLFLSSPLMAQSRGQIKRDIRDLSYRIERDIDVSEASNNRLRQVKRLLEDALTLVRDGGDGPTDPDLFKECLDYSHGKFRRTYDDSTSLEKARVICKRVADMDVLKFLYEKHFRSLNSGDSMQLAGEQAIRGTRSKVNLLEFAYQKHFRSYNSSESATRGVVNIKQVELRRSGEVLACFEKYYKIYFRNMNSSLAMDKTAETCSDFN
jgi:hypothetical protein